ncbi:MAG TPA: right-handed parallel beta-helix repeat-containing protein [Candidatus Dormibacteraeota bacterium]|nr:right-handed parallel beta-helix repeat-containing protein [Candidatus Dormibacteraeota bacterium]
MPKIIPIAPLAHCRVAAMVGIGALVFMTASLPVTAATYYVDGNCPSAGDGTTTACGTHGPKLDIQSGIGLLSAGDTLNIRGVHTAHDGETRNSDGRYFGDQFSISGKNGSSGSPITIQGYGSETAYLDGTMLPLSGWTQCTSCGSGVCGGVPGTCADTWYATSSPPSSKVIGAQKPDGSMTYRVTSSSDLTNAHSGYAGTAPEIDSYSPQSVGGTILVKWGQGGNAPLGSANPKPYVFNDNNAYGFVINSSSFITIKGLTFRCHRRYAVSIDSGSHDIIVQNNKILYDSDVTGNGSGYGIGSFGATNITITGNEIGWSDSEGIHVQAAASGPTVYTITGNWIHDNGNQNVMGPAATGTPCGMILGDNGGGTGNGDYTGSVIDNNLISRQKSGSSIGRGIILENNSNNWIIRSNIFEGSDGECIKLDANGISTNGNQIYNNIFLRCGQGGGGPGLYFNVTGSNKSASNNKVYNNTFVDNVGGAIASSCSGPCTGNVFRNDLLYDSGSRQLVYWSPGGTFQNNLVYSSAGGTLVSFNGRTSGCSGLVVSADVDNDGTANDSVICANPLLLSLSGNDLHLNSLSPARDKGTANGMPAGRTASIYNTVAGAHNFPSYADNQSLGGSAWDIGAVEYGAAVGPSATLVLSDPSPTAAGNVGLVLTTSASVVQLPGPLVFTASDSSTRTIVLSGAVPGTTFTGTLRVDTTIPDGPGTFSLPLNSLVDASGNLGNAIVSGSQTLIDKTPPAAPSNLRTGS